MTDQIADLLVRIRNASAIGKTEVIMPFSKMKEAILTILKDEKFVDEIKVVEDKSKKYIKVQLGSARNLSHLKQISKPGHRIYTKSKDIKIPLRGFGLLIVSTPSGVISGIEAVKKGVGGEVICEIW